VTWWLVLKFKTGAWLFLQIRVFSWLFLKFTLKYTGFAVRATSKPQPPSCKGLLLVAQARRFHEELANAMCEMNPPPPFPYR